MVKDSDHPSKCFPSNIWRVSICQNFALSKFCAIRSLSLDIKMAAQQQQQCWQFCSEHRWYSNDFVFWTLFWCFLCGCKILYSAIGINISNMSYEILILYHIRFYYNGGSLMQGSLHCLCWTIHVTSGLYTCTISQCTHPSCVIIIPGRPVNCVKLFHYPVCIHSMLWWPWWMHEWIG